MFQHLPLISDMLHNPVPPLMTSPLMPLAQDSPSDPILDHSLSPSSSPSSSPPSPPSSCSQPKFSISPSSSDSQPSGSTPSWLDNRCRNGWGRVLLVLRLVLFSTWRTRGRNSLESYTIQWKIKGNSNWGYIVACSYSPLSDSNLTIYVNVRRLQLTISGAEHVQEFTTNETVVKLFRDIALKQSSIPGTYVNHRYYWLLNFS